MLDLAARMAAELGHLPAELQLLRRRQLHFATAPVPSLQGGGGWLPRLLAQWRSQRRVLRAETKSGKLKKHGEVDGQHVLHSPYPWMTGIPGPSGPITYRALTTCG